MCNNNSFDYAIALVDKVLGNTAETLKYSFESYWSTYGNTGAHESNISLHVAGNFIKEGLGVFGEGHSEGSAKVRYDLIAYSKNPSFFVVSEFKHLWKSSKAEEMRHDVERLLKFRPVKRKLESSSSVILGLIGAFCEEDERLSQLLTRNDLGKCSYTNNLIKTIPHGKCWKAYKISSHGWHPDKPKPLYLVYSVFEVSETCNI